MQTIKIPENPSPYWACTIGDKQYKYPSGTTQEVPDEVAKLIEDISGGEGATEKTHKATAGDVLTINDDGNAEWKPKAIVEGNTLIL